MDKKFNILFLVSRFDIGGVERSNVQMINKIDKNKFNVHVLYIKEGILKDDLTNDIKITKLGNTLKLKSLINIKYIVKISSYIKNQKIDIVHSIDPVLYVVGAFAAKFAKAKHIRTQPNFIRRHEKLNSKTLRVLPFEKWTDKYITYQNASAQDLNLAGVSSEKIETIRDFSRLDEFLYFNDIKKIKNEFDIPDKNKIIVAMHRMVEKKGYETFIEMIPHIIKEYPNVTFLLVGDGPLRQSFQNKVDLLNIAHYVRFTGFRKDIANILKQVDFGVYPLADTAAMVDVIKTGKILITKKHSSMDEYIIDGETGYLLDDESPEEYAKYSLLLLKNEELLKSMEMKQREYVLENFNGDKNIKKLEEIFLSL